MTSERRETRTGGRPATAGVIPGQYALAVGKPDLLGPPGWSWQPLVELTRLETGHTPSRKKPEYWGGDIPWIGIRDATGNHGRRIDDTAQHTNELGIENSSARVLPPNTVCLSRTASVGYVVVMGREMATSQDFVNWVCSGALDWRYLKYVLLAEHESIKRFAHGTTHQTVYFPEVKAFHILTPPIDEQRRIADFLGTLDDAIENNRRLAKTLEEIAAALFKSWFVDFVGHNNLVETEAGMIPSGWNVEPVGEVLRIVGGSTPSTKDPTYWDNGSHCWATPKDLSGRDVPVILDTRRHISDAGVEQISSGLLPPRTVLMSSRAPVGYTAISFVPLAVNQGFIAVPPSPPVPSEYVLFWMRSNMSLIKANASGTTFAEISKGAFRALPMLVPPDQELMRFKAVSKPIFDRIVTCSQEIGLLTEIRDALLPRLISGALRTDAAALEGTGT